MNRETWLNEIIALARPDFEAVGSPLPDNVRAGIGLMTSRKHAGECWSDVCSEDGGREIWICPEHASKGAMSVCSTLIHELCHAALPFGVAHKAPFKKLGEKMLLEGKPTSMAGGEEFKEVWGPRLEALGEYPGAGFSRAAAKKKSTSPGPVKIVCSDTDCNTPFRIAPKYVRETEGQLSCPVCSAPAHPE